MYRTIYLLFLLAVATLVEAYEQPAIGQITPAANPTTGGIGDQSKDEEVTPVIEDSMSAEDSIKSSGATTSNSSESIQALDHKYTTTPDSVGSLNEETLLEKIFNKVDQDLRASGITGTYP